MMKKFLNKKYKVSYHDPFIKKINIENFKLKSLELNKKNFFNKIVIITTDHENVNYKEILNYSLVVFDTRGAYRYHKPDKKIFLI